jgi:1-deoxy-D-xylulose-5-phosphate reductoisomerase
MNSKKNIAILGSTGSIGKSTLEVVRKNPEYLNITCLTANKNVIDLAKQINEFKPKYAYIDSKDSVNNLEIKIIDSKTKIIKNKKDLCDVLASNEIDSIVSAMSGSSGLFLTNHALNNNKQVLLANKESMVMAGPIFKKFKQNIIPVDSEHNSIFQLIDRSVDYVSNIVLTASGGPFRTLPSSEFKNITKDMALKHPNWSMGEKITIDSATMMNKCLEIIEAFYLFDFKPEDISVLIHPESIIHSIVNFLDGSSLCQFSEPNMQIPISYALAYPQRIYSGRTSYNLADKNLTFHNPDLKKFPSIALAYNALKTSANHCLVMNAANEIAVENFLKQKISFIDIFNIIWDSFNIPNNEVIDNIDEILYTDELYRSKINKILNKYIF